MQSPTPSNDFTTLDVSLPLGVWCCAHASKIESIAQHGVHSAEDICVAASGQGRRLRVPTFMSSRIISLKVKGKSFMRNDYLSQEENYRSLQLTNCICLLVFWGTTFSQTIVIFQATSDG